MPQGRRKIPFSGKAKKEQLKAKKHGSQGPRKKDFSRAPDGEDSDDEVMKLNAQPRTRPSRGNPNRYVLQFRKESDAEIKRQKEAAYETIVRIPDAELEISSEQFYSETTDFPVRPPWRYDMNKDELDAREHRYFLDYVKKLEKSLEKTTLGYLELNLETWRQLWRVLEISDIILFIVDIRFAAAMFPPCLYTYVTETLKKKMIIALNKIDLAPASLVVAWRHYFQQKYPDLHVLTFTTFPGYNMHGKQSDAGGLQTRRRRGKIKMAAEGAQVLYDACKNIVENKVDLSSWHSKIMEELSSENDFGELEVGETIEHEPSSDLVMRQGSYESGILTIGCVGQPNVGKSSLMNALMGKKVVSVSRTPGHTKHFQTIFLTRTVRLCDCPGLVFPSKIPKMMQVLTGVFPISQLRVPYPAIRYIAERIDLPKLLRVTHPEVDDSDEWSAIDICEAWARKRGFFTAKASRPDTYRAANNILRMQLDGKVCLCLRPPGYEVSKPEWETHPEIETVCRIQARRSENSNVAVDEHETNSESDTSNTDRSEVDGSESEISESRSRPTRSKPQSRRKWVRAECSSSSSSEEKSNVCPETVCNKFSALEGDSSGG